MAVLRVENSWCACVALVYLDFAFLKIFSLCFAFNSNISCRFCSTLTLFEFCELCVSVCVWKYHETNIITSHNMRFALQHSFLHSCWMLLWFFAKQVCCTSKREGHLKFAVRTLFVCGSSLKIESTKQTNTHSNAPGHSKSLFINNFGRQKPHKQFKCIHTCTQFIAPIHTIYTFVLFLFQSEFSLLNLIVRLVDALVSMGMFTNASLAKQI